MGYFIDKHNKFTVYNVPKIGSTTIRSWIAYAGTGSLQLQGSDQYYHENPEAFKLLNEWGYTCDWFSEFEGESICVKRDPVKRFISCYDDKVVKENRLPGVSLDEFLDNPWEIIEKMDKPLEDNKYIGYLYYHFVPQAKHLGKNYDYYTKVFDIKELNTEGKKFFESKWGIELPDLVCRSNPKKKTTLNEEQLAKVKALYAEDYQIGWS